MRPERLRRQRILRPSAGFSLIEVLIAILVMGVGLLGFALMQTTSLRFANSSNQRTQATNLTYDLLDQIRANRLAVSQFTGASFSAGGGGTGRDCTNAPGDVGVSQSIDRWQCQVVAALGADASANVTYQNGLVSVTVSWADEQRWNTDAAATSFVARTRL